MRILEEMSEDPREAADLLESATLADAVGAQERAVLAEVEAMQPGPLDDVVERVIGPLAARRRGARRASALRLVAGLAAVAALVLVFVEFRSPSEDPRTDSILGSAQIELIAPAAVVDAWGEFSWNGPDAGRGRYEIRLFPRTDSTASDFARGLNLKETRWLPTDTTTWPRALRWEVRLLDQTGELLDSESGEARLR